MNERVWTLPESLRQHSAFSEDLRALIALSPEELKALRGAVEPLVAGAMRREMIERAARALRVGEAEAGRLGFTLRFLATHVVERSVAPSDLVKEVIDFLEVDLSESETEALSDVIAPTSAEIADTRSRDAFAYGNTLLGASFTPLLTPHGADDELHAGLSFTLTYRTGDGAQKSVSINASVVEFREIAQQMMDAAKRADALSPRRGSP